MAQLLESGQAADVRFKVEGEELAAHKFILTARSPVFRLDVCLSLAAPPSAWYWQEQHPDKCIALSGAQHSLVEPWPQ